MKLYIDEEGTAIVRQQVAEEDVVGTSAIAYVEARAAFARRHHAGDFSAEDHRRIVQDLEADWAGFVILEVTDAVIRDAARLAEEHRLRAYDAVHLASARVLRERLDQLVTVASWDVELDEAAVHEGFASLRGRR